MARALYLLFNHQITKLQQSDARASLGVQEIKDLPADLKEIWCRIPPDLLEIDQYLTPIKTWLSENSSKSDYVLIQGDFGATYIMVNYAFEKGLIPLYSTTSREAIEEHQPDGSVKLTHSFKHKIFRFYELPSKIKTTVPR